MTASITIQGMAEVQKNLNDQLAKIKDNTGTGIAAAALFIKGEAQQLTSVDHGILINSAFSKETGTKEDPAATVGYTAEYAPYVHEMPDSTNWNRPGAEGKFLEKAVARNLEKILKIVARFAGRG